MTWKSLIPLWVVPALLLQAADQPKIEARKAGVLGAFGASDTAVLDVVFGKARPTGKLPFDLPSDMPSVMAQAADVPFDIDDPLFRFGFGLTYSVEPRIRP
jgi:beta-glucosidase